MMSIIFATVSCRLDKFSSSFSSESLLCSASAREMFTVFNRMQPPDGYYGYAYMEVSNYY